MAKSKKKGSAKSAKKAKAATKKAPRAKAKKAKPAKRAGKTAAKGAKKSKPVKSAKAGKAKAAAKKPRAVAKPAAPKSPAAVEEWSDDAGAAVRADDHDGDDGDEGGGGVEGGGGGEAGGGPIEGGGANSGGVEGAGADDDGAFEASPDDAPRISEMAGKAMIVQILGDAEAYFFDFMRLSPARREELIANHVAAYDRRKQAEGKSNWSEELVPVALLGESMPPPVRDRFDLSAPHEGLVLYHTPSGALLYAASKDDDKLAILAPDLATISPHDSFIDEVFDPNAQSFAYQVDRTQSEGFTLHEIETLMQVAGAQLTLV